MTIPDPTPDRPFTVPKTKPTKPRTAVSDTNPKRQRGIVTSALAYASGQCGCLANVSDLAVRGINRETTSPCLPI